MYSEELGWDDVWCTEHKEEIVYNVFFCYVKSSQITHTLMTYIAHCSKHLLVSALGFQVRREVFLACDGKEDGNGERENKEQFH